METPYSEFINLLKAKTNVNTEDEVDMRRSKLEVHLDLLKALARYGPLKLTHMMYRTEVNCKDLKQYLELLIKQNLVEERAVGKKRTTYAITERGIAVLKTLRKLEDALKVRCATALY